VGAENPKAPVADFDSPPGHWQTRCHATTPEDMVFRRRDTLSDDPDGALASIVRKSGRLGSVAQAGAVRDELLLEIVATRHRGFCRPSRAAAPAAAYYATAAGP